MDRNDTFEAILDLEFEVQGAHASTVHAPADLPTYLRDGQWAAWQRVKALLGAAIDALSPDELAAFAAYRAASRSA